MSALRDLPPLAWFLIAFGLGIFIQWNQAMALGDGDFAALLSVGERSALRPAIEEQLGPVPLMPGSGHDGQASFITALDPLARGEAAQHLDHPGYRYRRILYPALAGGFGTLDGRLVVQGLAFWSAAGLALAVAAFKWFTDRFGLPEWTVLAVLVNPGLWLSVKLLTPDTLAFGLAMAGVTLWLNGRHLWAVSALALACLTKEPYLLVVLGLAGWEWSARRHHVHPIRLLSAVLPLVAWSLWLSFTLGRGFDPRGNLAIPFLGIVQAVPRWPASGELWLAASVLGALILTALTALITRSTLFAWLAIPWVAVGIVSSPWVWDFGNNAARALAPVFTSAVVGAGLVWHGVQFRGSERPLPERAS